MKIDIMEFSWGEVRLTMNAEEYNIMVAAIKQVVYNTNAITTGPIVMVNNNKMNEQIFRQKVNQFLDDLRKAENE